MLKSGSPFASLFRIASLVVFVGSIQCYGQPTRTPTPGPVSVTISTIPENRMFIVDSVEYTSSQTFHWTEGTSHTISTTSIQEIGGYTRFLWENWSDGGEQTHAIIASHSTPTYTAHFRTQHKLTTCCTNARFYVWPSTGFIDAGSVVTIGAGSFDGYVFRGWSGSGNGSYSGPYNNATVTMNGPISQGAIWLFPPGGRTAFDYDGNGRADVSVFRPSEGIWYFHPSTAVQFGLSTDKIVPGDYNGDRKADIAVFRPSEGNWYILNSANGTFSVRHFGLAGDIPAPSDYDGDGVTNLAVFRPSDGTWYIEQSWFPSPMRFGQEGDIPAPGDYDGDGKADITVYRPSEGIWYRVSSINGSFSGVRFGLPGDRMVASSYLGVTAYHLQTYMAVYRPSTSTWYILRNPDFYSSHQFGLPGDIPVPADYNGDGKADIAVFRPSEGMWYIANSSGNAFSFYQWGLSGDIPTQNAFGD